MGQHRKNLNSKQRRNSVKHKNHKLAEWANTTVTSIKEQTGDVVTSVLSAGTIAFGELPESQ